MEVITLTISGITSLVKCLYLLPIKFFIGICEDYEFRHQERR